MLIPEDVKIYLCTSVTDMRKSIDTLCILISETLKMNPLEGHLFLFHNRRGNKIKILYYEINCFTLWYRRLEKGKFIFPKNAETGSIELSQEHFRWLMMSDKYSRMDAMKSPPYLHFH